MFVKLHKRRHNLLTNHYSHCYQMMHIKQTRLVLPSSIIKIPQKIQELISSRWRSIVSTPARCALGPNNFEKRPTRKAKTQERCEPNLRFAVKTNVSSGGGEYHRIQRPRSTRKGKLMARAQPRLQSRNRRFGWGLRDRSCLGSRRRCQHHRNSSYSRDR